MTIMKRTILFFLLYLLIINSSIPYIVPSRVVYNHRVNFNVVKNRAANIDAAIEQIKITIKKEKIKDYIIIIGDSVSYGSPGPPHGSLGYYLNRISKESNKQLNFFNLAIPSMQIGDIYTILLKLKKYGLSDKNIIINICYSSFVKRTYGHPVATWFSEELEQLDYTAYSKVEYNLLSEKEAVNPANPNEKILKKTNIVSRLFDDLFKKINILKYKDYLQQGFLEVYNTMRKRTPIQNKAEPWYTKEWLKDYMKQDEIQWGLSDEAFILNDSNEDIYFLEKILKMQKQNNLLIYLAALNRDLLYEETSKAGFNENLERIDKLFASKEVDYINFDKKINSNFFSDHIHLIPKGYYYMAQEIWKLVEEWDFQ